jgi:hypothetical protein
MVQISNTVIIEHDQDIKNVSDGVSYLNTADMVLKIMTTKTELVPVRLYVL